MSDKELQWSYNELFSSVIIGVAVPLLLTAIRLLACLSEFGGCVTKVVHCQNSEMPRSKW